VRVSEDGGTLPLLHMYLSMSRSGRPRDLNRVGLWSVMLVETRWKMEETLN
jgi:hypothetical protein